jgi:hypothetical protein
MRATVRPLALSPARPIGEAVADVPDWVPVRQKIWQITGGLQCSIVGTCLSHDDLMKVARKCGARFAPHVTPYDVHGTFVKEASSDTRIARALQKLLDKRFAAIVARLDKCTADAEREALWNEETAAGRIAGAYWAFVSDTRVPRRLFTRIFGEVHMLSHVHGRITHQTLSKLSDLQAERDHLEAHLTRMSARNRELAAERDAALAGLASSRAAAPARSALPAADRALPILRRSAIDSDARLARKDRALIAARERARGAEARVGELEQRIARLEILLAARPAGPAPDCPAAAACIDAVRQDVSRKVLYIGGRAGMIELLRRAAAEHRATFVHHDGGLEQAMSRIDSLIEGCDAVFCPIDCVSHAACVKAKTLCKRMQKPFIPLRSSGAVTFQRALATLPQI